MKIKKYIGLLIVISSITIQPCFCKNNKNKTTQPPQRTQQERVPVNRERVIALAAKVYALKITGKSVSQLPFKFANKSSNT